MLVVSRTVELPYGSRPCQVELTGDVRVLEAPHLRPPRPIRELLDEAIDRAPVPTARRITLIVSDATRAEPRAELVAAVRRRQPDARWTLAIATGTHGPCGVERLGLDWDGPVVDHDGRSGVVELGVTARGTPVRVHRCVLDADLVIATGCIRPHYFAGFGAGVKAIFPGLGEERAIRINHRWKTDPQARAGVIDGNPCREDLVEAVGMVPTPTYLLNGVCGPDGLVHAAVAGELEAAFRAGVAQARPWFTVRADRAPLVIASDALPVTATLYQAAKIAAAAAPLVEPGGILAVVAECGDGIGPLEVVNEAILRIGVLPRLPSGARLVLVSGLARASVEQTLIEPATLDQLSASRALVIPRASQLICEPAS